DKSRVLLPEQFSTTVPQHVDLQDTASSRTAEMPAPLAPLKQKSFVGITQSRYFPPDPTIAVGPSHIMLAVNSSLAFYTKTGHKISEIRFAAWFDALKISQASLFDPRLAYDQYSGHFIFVVDAVR